MSLPAFTPLKGALRRRLDAWRRFVATDTGAVTVDWVVLTAAMRRWG